MLRTAALLACLAAPAAGGVNEAIDDAILPATASFAETAGALAATAAGDCRAEAVRPAYHAAFDAWLGIGHLRLGPLEEQGRALAIAFWPDTRGITPRTVAGLIADDDPALASPDEFAEVSVAGRGLFAMEQVLYDDTHAGYGEGTPACALVRMQAADLARMAAAVDAEWRGGFAGTLRTAGAEGNATFLDEREAQRALYTALVTGLEFDKDQRVGRPLGTFDRPRPNRAEARRSGRSLRNVVLSLEALRDLARGLSDVPIPRTEAAFADALEMAEALGDPVFAAVEDPQGWLEADILRQRIDFAQDAVSGEIGAVLGITAGFNAADGD
jgi:predicted lipoprotein